MTDDLDAFYDLIDLLEERVGGRRTLATASGRGGWPARGVYFFFEPGEVRRNRRPRVVRVGTHALKTGSSTTLWKRLAQHRGAVGGSNPGGGNHRGSVFRLHVGTALLARDIIEETDAARPTWGQRGTAPREVRSLEVSLERAVSAYIGAMPVLWVSVDDEPGPNSDRGTIESSAIALLSNLANPSADQPSEHWLGHHSSRPAIRGSGLWNVNHVDDLVSDRFFATLEGRIRDT